MDQVIGDGAAPGNASEWISERLCEAVRNQNVDDIDWKSPCAAALFPLLEALGWKNYARELIEAFPHFARDIDLIDLRNILVNLGYESSARECRLEDIREEFYPCLFVATNGDVLVLLERQGDEIGYFDADLEKTHTRRVFDCAGTAYLFTDTHPTHAVSAGQGSQSSWFFQLAGRFRPLLLHLFAMSFFINFIALAVPLFVMVIYDKVIGSKSVQTLPYLLSGIAILMMGDLLLRFLRARLLGSVAGRLDYLIGIETFRKLLSLPPLFTERSTVAAQLSRLQQFDSIRDLFTGPSASLLLEMPFIILFVGVVFLLAGPIGFIPPLMVLVYVVFGMLWLPGLTSRVIAAGRTRGDKQLVLMQTLDGRSEIKAVGGEKIWWERFREVSGEAVSANYRTFVASGIMNSIAQSIMTLSGVAILGVGTLAVMEGSLSVGALIATMALTWRVLSPLQGAFLSYSKFQQAFKAMRQINQLMTLKEERQSSQAGLMLQDVRGRIQLNSVSFRYSPDKDPALMGISFLAEPGEMVAIVGGTGSGKSTLLKLIAGMYRPQAGSLVIDNLDIRQLNAVDLRRAIAYVPQETKLFHGTITQNLRLNNGLATHEQIHRAAREAGVLEEILALPDGFETRIGDSDTGRFPAGFIRGLAIARAFVNPAKIILLDEPGASLDSDSDRRFMEQVRRLKGTRTVIMVSHRPSHIRMADKAVMLEDGVMKYVGHPDKAVEAMMGDNS